jgi:hypothetical protein
MATKTKDKNTADTPQNDADTNGNDNGENEETQDAPRSEAVTVGPTEGGNSVLAAWQGLVHLFGAQVERFDVTPEGVVAVNLSFDANVPHEQIVSDLFKRGDTVVTRRLDLIPTYFWAQGETPADFADAGEMTAWMVQYFKGAGEGDGSRSPEYVKQAIADHKKETGIAAPRGRKRKIVRLDALDDIKPESLVGVDVEELKRLQATIERAMQLSAEQSNQSSAAASA